MGLPRPGLIMDAPVRPRRAVTTSPPRWAHGSVPPADARRGAPRHDLARGAGAYRGGALLAAEVRPGLSRAVIVLVLVMIGLNIALMMFEPKPPSATAPTPPASDVFEGYDTAVLADEVIARDRLSGQEADRIRDLYSQLQKSVDDKEVHHDGLDRYLGERSAYLHGILYGRMMVVVWTEVGVLAMFVAMTIVGYDRAAAVQPVIWSSALGRRVWGWKLLASTVFALGAA
ncbi:MAG: hypothetical protein LBV00_00920, partial [Propionibacteriaceae bacterium]|nr:hypothetical protein [Propionibacteriaceae bacterium]